MLFVWVGQECRGIDIQCITTAGLLLHCEGDPVDSLQVSSSQLYARLKQECYYRSVPGRISGTLRYMVRVQSILHLIVWCILHCRVATCAPLSLKLSFSTTNPYGAITQPPTLNSFLITLWLLSNAVSDIWGSVSKPHRSVKCILNSLDCTHRKYTSRSNSANKISMCHVSIQLVKKCLVYTHLSVFRSHYSRAHQRREARLE